MIAIIDYGMGNLGSVSKALSYLGFENRITADKEIIMNASGVILPGVGAIAQAMDALKKTGLDCVVRDYAASGKPFMGICLGMQMLFDESEESADGQPVHGLGLIPGRVVRFSDGQGLKVPQIGWNSLTTVHDSLFSAGEYVYFVHSYYCIPKNDADVAATTTYGIEYASAVSHDNITACQFHPEKSGEVGLSILNRWARRTRA